MRFHSDSTSKTSSLASTLRGRLAARRERSVHRAARQVVEQLESRQLLAVVAAGQTGFFYTGTNIVRVSVTGEGSITLVGFTRPRDATTPGRTGVAELPMTVFDADGGVADNGVYNGGFNDGTAQVTGGTATTPPIYEIYSIYSGDSTSNTSVAISTSTVRTGTGPTINRLVGGNVQPYGGSAGSLRTNMLDAGDDADRVITLGNGGVFLGGRDGVDATHLFAVYSQTKNISIATSPGVKLKNNATLKPGVYVTGALDNFFFGGTITGAVNVSGSVNTFYAGNVLTGDVTRGTNGTLADPVLIGTDNFSVGGDLRNLITSGGIGTVSGAPRAFIPNTDIQVGGKIQQVKAAGNFRAAVEAVGNYNASTSDGSSLTELESREARNVNANFVNSEFFNYRFVNQGFANDDSIDAPQILGSYFSPDRNRGQQVTLTGSINNAANTTDNVDYYGLPLLAGQSAVVQVIPTLDANGIAGGPVALQVIDPDGNIVFSDYSNQNSVAFSNRAFTVTADQPGLWKLAVVPYNVAERIVAPYQLTIDKVGELAVGGVQSGGEMYLSNSSLGIRGRNGDVGAVLAGGDLFTASGLTFVGGEPDVTNPIVAERGNVRSVQADNFGLLEDGTLFTDTFPTIMASKSVGLVRTTVSRLYFNMYSRGLNDQPSTNLTIGGDYQVVETPGDFSGVLSANGGIGVIRVGSIDTDELIAEPGYFEINADGTNNDGIIGLIDVAGDMGTFLGGGPAIRAGQGANVRYIRVGGNAYRDRQFGAGNTIVQTTTNSALPAIVDDSGALITITPIASQTYTAPADVPVTVPVPESPGDLFGSGTVIPPVFGTGTSIPNPFGGTGTPTTPTTPTTATTDTNGDGVIDNNDLPVDTVDGTGNVSGTIVAGTVTVETYPVRTGGSVILNVTASAGVQINTTGNNATAAGDVAEIRTGSGTAVVIANADPTKPTTLETAATLGSGTTMEVLLTGSVQTNVFSIAGSGGTAANGAPANYTRIVNTTDGEIVNVNAGSLAYIEAQYLGVGRTMRGVAIEGRAPAAGASGLPNAGGFSSIRNLVSMGNGIEIRSRGQIGNVSGTSIQNLVANSDRRNTRGVTEGIVGIVFAASELRNVDIGEGLSTSGTGTQIRAGLYSNDTIGTVTNVNGGGDIRGDVIALNNIEAITLTGGGSIVDSDILQAGNATLTLPDGTTAPSIQAGDERYNFNIQLISGVDTTSGIGTISVTGGNGGIINAQVVGLNIGLTTVGAGGFGVLTSRFFSSGGGRMDGISAAGLGIRGTEYTGGGTMGDIIATGGGALADLNNYSDAVRASRDSYFDSNTGIGPNAANDVYQYFQTSTADSAIIGVTNEGIIADSTIAASQSIGNIRAFDFRTFNNPLGIKARAESFPSQINFGQSIGSITAKRDINGLRVVGATVGSIVARDIKNFQLQTTGAVGTINAKRNVLGSVNFNLVNDGALTNLLIGGNFNATLSAARGIDRIVIDGSLASQAVNGSGGLYSGLNIRSVRIGGDVRDGTLLRARKRITSLLIAGDLDPLATVRANPFGKVTINGATEGRVLNS